MNFTLNEQQADALAGMQDWFADDHGSPFFVLGGYAGVGKTFLCKSLAAKIKGRVVFTAPTNKAVKVLRETMTSDAYKPECATIYSLLGLRMEASGEVKVLAARDPDDDELDLSVFRLVVVDEGSMLNAQVLDFIHEAIEQHPGLKFLFMGDPAQLPPVKEVTSPIWKLDAPKAMLTQVMRHDNQILKLVTSIREVVDAPFPNLKLAGDHDANGGVWHLSAQDFHQLIRQRAATGDFEDGTKCKVVAWRNVAVDKHNAAVRQVIFGADTLAFVVGDRVIFTSPAKDLDDRPIARTDDEGLVMSASVQDHPLYPSFKCWRLGITLDDSRVVTAFTLHQSALGVFDRECQDIAARAKVNGRVWREFWALKEAFHGVRHAYALTAHRAQGSTYKTVFVDYRDILMNRNRQEAYRCLYVAASRPTTNLILG